MTRACPDLPSEASENLINYTPYSCRQKCSMTSSTARGCAMVGEPWLNHLQ